MSLKKTPRRLEGISHVIYDEQSRLHHRDLHRRGNERAWWERQRIEPLHVAAKLWDQTHAAAPAAANIAGDRPTPIDEKRNGHCRINAASRPPTDETKPILRPEGK
jgi:hypothetical protein